MRKVKVDPRLQHIYDEAIKIVKDNQKELLKYSDIKCLSKAMRDIAEVRLNNKATSRRGCMKPQGRDQAIIEISGYMLAFPEKEVITTMVHEILHCFKDSKGHTGEWSWRAKKISELTGLNVVRTRSIENEWQLRKEFDEKQRANRVKKANIISTNRRKSNKQIVCRCCKCGIEIVRSKETRFTQNPQRYRHRNCGGHFERVGIRVEL